MSLAIRDPLCPLLHQVLIRNHRSSEQRLLLHITDFTLHCGGQTSLGFFLFVSVLLLDFFFGGVDLFDFFSSSLNTSGVGRRGGQDSTICRIIIHWCVQKWNLSLLPWPFPFFCSSSHHHQYQTPPNPTKP